MKDTADIHSAGLAAAYQLPNVTGIQMVNRDALPKFYSELKGKEKNEGLPKYYSLSRGNWRKEQIGVKRRSGAQRSEYAKPELKANRMISNERPGPRAEPVAA
jgi:hypothetical protein